LKLGPGIAAVTEMLGAGMNVRMGTDGALCNNTYETVREMQLASILQSGHMQSAGALPATKVLEMATLNATKALGLEDHIGSPETGQWANFVVINPDPLAAGATPWDPQNITGGGVDPVTVVVHSCTGRNVDIVVVNGIMGLLDGNLVGIDEDKLVAQAHVAAAETRKRSSIKAKSSTWRC
jgi:cytosine/adenosine deaminase-related metal-dependent hydrolase